MVRVTVHFDDRKGFFYPDERVRGDVILKVDEATVCWKVTAEIERIRVAKKVFCFRWGTKKERVGETLTLMDRTSSREDLSFKPGVVQLPFDFKLPSKLPPSFKARGYVQYQIKVTIVASGLLFRDLKTRMPLKIFVPAVDLLRNPKLNEAQSKAKEKYLCFLCLETGPVYLSGTIPKQVYNPGEQLAFSCDLDNKNIIRPVRKVEAKLIATYTYLNSDGIVTKKNKQVISSLKIHGRIRERKSHYFLGEIGVPSKITPSFRDCSSLHLEYHLVLSASIAFALAAKISIPVEISSIIDVTENETETEDEEEVEEAHLIPEQCSSSSLIRSPRLQPTVIME